MSIEGLLIEMQSDILRITFNRPDRLNSLSAEIVHVVADTIDAAPAQGARVVVLTGAGRAFSSGADVGADGAPPGLDTLDAGNRLVTSITLSVSRTRSKRSFNL